MDSEYGTIDEWDLFSTPTQGVVKTHGPAQCEGRPCCVHNPSDHHMADWPLVFDMNKMAMGERICEHFHKHPDPDSYTYFRDRVPIYVLKGMFVHNCCGCCTPPKNENR